MVTRLSLGSFSNRNYTTSSFIGRNKWVLHSYSTAQRVETNVQHQFKNMKKPLDFDQFKEEKVKSFVDYKNSPIVKDFFGGDLEKISTAYRDYCICKYNRYLQSFYSGNAATML